jgi:hypothetical protein
MKFETYFGQVTGYLNTEEFTTDECTIIARDSDNDGPYWEDDSHDWQTLNDLCYQIKDDNLYGVATRADHPEVLIDSTSSYNEMNTWSAWVTDNPAKLHDQVKKELIEELRGKVNRDMIGLNDESLGMSDVVEWADEIYTHMKDNDDSGYLDAWYAIIEAKGY